MNSVEGKEDINGKKTRGEQRSNPLSSSPDHGKNPHNHSRLFFLQLTLPPPALDQPAQIFSLPRKIEKWPTERTLPWQINISLICPPPGVFSTFKTSTILFRLGKIPPQGSLDYKGGTENSSGRFLLVSRLLNLLYVNNDGLGLGTFGFYLQEGKRGVSKIGFSCCLGKCRQLSFQDCPLLSVF